jgi:hypothetical protein
MSHAYSSGGNFTIKGLVSGRGLVTPQEKTYTIAVARMINVGALEVTGVFERGDTSPEIVSFPESYPGSPDTEIPMEVSVSLHVSGRIKTTESSQLYAYLGFGGQPVTGSFVGTLHVNVGFIGTIRVDGSDRYVTPQMAFEPYVASQSFPTLQCVVNEPEVQMSYDSEGGYWYHDIDLTRAVTLGFTGDRFEEDWYYHYLTNRALDWLSYPAGAVDANGDPLSEHADVEFNMYKGYINQTNGVYRKYASQPDALAWSIGYSLSAEAWRYYVYS